MKYRTFRSLTLLAGAGAVAGLGYMGLRSCGGSHQQAVPTPPAAASADPGVQPSAAPPPGPAPAPAGAPSSARGAVALREVDRAALELAGRPISGDKKKDALPSQPFKINLYQDPGSRAPNRLKIDLDRDDKWDEKWTFEPDGKVRRQVAPADDENYTEEWLRDEEYWVSPSMLAAVSAKGPAEAASPAAPPAGSPGAAGDQRAAPAGEGLALRPFDQEVAALAGRALSGGKLKDALPGRPFKVNLYQDEGKPGANRLKLDLDRDDKWDEKWTFEEEGGRPKVKRQVAPEDDEQYTLEYRLQAGRWVAK